MIKIKPLVVVQGPVATRSGYGNHTRDLVRSLIAMNKYEIQIISLPWGACPMNALNDKDPKDIPIIDRFLRTQLTSRYFYTSLSSKRILYWPRWKGSPSWKI